jgi:hypothetical protein
MARGSAAAAAVAARATKGEATAQVIIRNVTGGSGQPVVPILLPREENQSEVEIAQHADHTAEPERRRDDVTDAQLFAQIQTFLNIRRILF